MSNSEARTPDPTFYAHLEAQRFRTTAGKLKTMADELELPTTLGKVRAEHIKPIQEARAEVYAAVTKLNNLLGELFDDAPITCEICGSDSGHVWTCRHATTEDLERADRSWWR